MRVVLLTSSLGPGGAERVASTLCNSWVKRGDAVKLIPTYSGGGKPFYDIDAGVNLEYLSEIVGDRSKSFMNYTRRFFALRRSLLEFRPDVVVSFLPNVNVVAILALACTGIPVVVCERRDPSSQPTTKIWENACSVLYRFADALVVQTQIVRNSIGEIYPNLKKVVTISNPLPLELMQRRPEKVEGDVRKSLLSLGRLAPEKQVEHTILTFSRIASTFLDWDLHIYGDGPMRAELEILTRELELSSRVFFGGQTLNPWQVMESCDAFVMTSKFEGFPNTLLEAMCIGLPCVAYDCRSGPRDISLGGDVALLANLGDQEHLSIHLSTLMGNQQLRQNLGERARESVIERFELNKILNDWDVLFKELGVKM